MDTQNSSSNSRTTVSFLLPYANPHVLDWVMKLNDSVLLNIGCVNPTLQYRPGYFSEYDEIEGIYYFYKGKESKKRFFQRLKEGNVLVSLGIFEKELLKVRRYCHKNVRLIVLSEPFNPINSERRNILRRIWGSIIRLLYNRVDFFCIGGEDVKKYFQRLGFKKSRFYQFGYFPDLKFASIAAKSEENQETIISFVGQLIARKGFDRLLKLIDYLTLSSYQYKLFIAGDGPNKEQLIQKIQHISDPNIQYLGLIDNKKGVRELLKKTDIVFVPSYFDGWGAIVNEAISQSCAVISSDQVYASKLLIVSDFNGFIFSHNFERYFEKYLSNRQLLNTHQLANKPIYDKWNSKNVALESLKVFEGKSSSLITEV
ncbi:MAG: glycosyltransferase [Parapedobacter sp.]|nr:MAG: glycosyltransferase [Parapedobacter sp.]